MDQSYSASKNQHQPQDVGKDITDSSKLHHQRDETTTGEAKRRKLSSTTTFLSEEEKKSRHIASEKKRRETIRLAFDRIVDLVPNLTPSESRTEVAVLTKSAAFIDELRSENQRLLQLLQNSNVPVPEHLLEAYNNTSGATSSGAQKTKEEHSSDGGE
ncbi:Ino4 protein [Saccharomycopsis crataegensis]|uniref:Ino4 protein n=1 Tax=Saccharomycopsis crataegensis TaxID=43959 RepID=A0AAV5QRM2_9ASCO|nr:Ino4 protein [Saccharomycopsis crataegensis]